MKATLAIWMTVALCLPAYGSFGVSSASANEALVPYLVDGKAALSYPSDYIVEPRPVGGDHYGATFYSKDRRIKIRFLGGFNDGGFLGLLREGSPKKIASFSRYLMGQELQTPERLITFSYIDSDRNRHACAGYTNKERFYKRIVYKSDTFHEILMVYPLSATEEQKKRVSQVIRSLTI